jgi:hypothetical protein
MDEWGSIPAGKGDFSLHHGVQTGPGAHLASYAMGTGVISVEIKRPGLDYFHRQVFDFQNTDNYC